MESKSEGCVIKKTSSDVAADRMYRSLETLRTDVSKIIRCPDSNVSVVDFPKQHSEVNTNETSAPKIM